MDSVFRDAESDPSWLPLSGQLRAIGTITVLVYFPLALVMAWAGFQQRVPIVELFREPKGDADVPFYTGAFTSIGVIFWSAATSACVLVGTLLWRSWRRMAAFLISMSLLTSFLLLDDIFLLHESVGPSYGVPERVVIVTHGVLLLIGLFFFRREVMQTSFAILALSLALFAVSLFIDHGPVGPLGLSYTTEYYWEEVFKLFGIVTWFLYFASVAVGLLTPKAAHGD